MTIAQMSGICINNNFQNPHRPFATNNRSQNNELSKGTSIGLDSFHNYNPFMLKSETSDNYESNDNVNSIWSSDQITSRLSTKHVDWTDIPDRNLTKHKDFIEGRLKAKDDCGPLEKTRKKSMLSNEVVSLKTDHSTSPRPQSSSTSLQPDYPTRHHLYMPPEHINGNVGPRQSSSHLNNNNLDFSNKSKNFWDDYRQHDFHRYHHHHHHHHHQQDQQQARIPWNLAGLVGHIPSESTPGHSQFPPHYPIPTSNSAQITSHVPHLLGHPGSSVEHPSLWTMGMHSHHLPGPGIDLTGADPTAFPYKDITDQMSMYYASQVSSGGTGPATSPSLTSSSLTILPTTTSNTTPTISTDTLVNSFQALTSIESGEMMQPLHSYFGQPDLPIAEDHGSWIESSHGTAAAVVAAVAANHPHHHHQHPGVVDSYPDYSIQRIGNNYTNRKKNLIKEWTKTNSTLGGNSNGQQPESGNENEGTTSGSSRSFLNNDFTYPSSSSSASPYTSLGLTSKDDNNGLRDYSSYGLHPYTAYSDLVHPYSQHHHPNLGHHTGQHLHAQQLAMTLGGVQGVNHQSHVDHHSNPPTLTKRKRKSEQKQHQTVTSTLVNIGGLTRDERKALSVGEAFTGLPLPVQDIIQLPMDEFNDLLSKHELSEEQLSLCRDIRRRGKNKVAARNCRRRKIDQIKQLEDDVTRIRCRKTELINEFEKLSAQRVHWSDMVRRLHDFVLKELGHDPNQYQLQMDHNRQIHILPRNQSEETELAKTEQPYHYAPHLGPTVMATMTQPRP